MPSIRQDKKYKKSSLLCKFTNSLITLGNQEAITMRDNSFDRTIERNYVQKWRYLIADYEAVKEGRSALFKRVGDFYRHHQTCSQTFRKYYNRYLQESRHEGALLPRRRGPKWRDRREPTAVEALVLEQRRLGCNRYEIYHAVRERRPSGPSASTIYRILRRHELNRLKPAMVEAKRRIIKEKVGELAMSICISYPRTCSWRPRKSRSSS